MADLDPDRLATVRAAETMLGDLAQVDPSATTRRSRHVIG
jgi:hypothetical protein